MSEADDPRPGGDSPGALHYPLWEDLLVLLIHPGTLVQCMPVGLEVPVDGLGQSKEGGQQGLLLETNLNTLFSPLF